MTTTKSAVLLVAVAVGLLALSSCGCDDGELDYDDGSYCETGADCGEGFECDTDRGECVPCGDAGCTPGDPGQCYAEPAGCGTEPICPSGSLAGVDPSDGCYTGLCIPEALCPDDPPFQCSDAADETECASYAQCEAVFVGINCTDPAGSSCTEGSSDCTCESFDYGLCRDKA